MEDFGDRAFIVKGIPLFMEYGEGKRFLEDILQSIDEGIDIKNSSKIDKLIMRSCKSAVKAHDVLSDIKTAPLCSMRCRAASKSGVAMLSMTRLPKKKNKSRPNHERVHVA